MKFEFDLTKAKNNWAKHGVTFAEASLALIDPHALTLPDDDHSALEERERTIGMVPEGKTLFVVHTTRLRAGGEFTRIISARKATTSEEMLYFWERVENE
jgi:uncharacterized DUF497 family protein